MFMPLTGVIILSIAWSVYWFAAMQFVQDAVRSRRVQVEGDGFSLSCSAETWSGFPFRFEFTCANPRVLKQNVSILESRSLQAVAQAYYPWHVLLLFDGPSRLSPIIGQSVQVHHDRALVSLRFRDTVEPEVSMEIANIRAEDHFEARSIMAHTRPEGAGQHGVAIAVEGFHHQRADHPPLDIESASLLSSLKPGRQLEVRDIVLKQRAVTWSGRGEITLDAEKRIAGTLHTRTNDLDGLLAIIDPHVEMNDQQRATFKTIIGLLGQQAEADIIARDGELYVGPFKIANLLPLY